MSEYNRQQAQRDAHDGKQAADMQNADWKAKQDYNAAYAAAEKAKNNK